MRLSDLIPLAEAALSDPSVLPALWDALQETLPERLAAGLTLGAHDQSVFESSSADRWYRTGPDPDLPRALNRLLARLRSSLPGVSGD